MPTVYQGICRDCGYTTSFLSEEYGAVFVDQPVAEAQQELAGAVIMAGNSGPMASIDDHRFVVLRHPGEESDLRATGYTWRDLLKQGRYVRVTNVICRECGTLFQRRRLAAPNAFGCVTALVLGVIVGLSAGIRMRSISAGFAAWFVGAMVVLIGAEFCAALYVRLRFRTRAKMLAAERTCPGCGADHAKKIGWGRSVACPSCRRCSLRFKVVGIS
jgi:hypothetical protein